MPRLRVYRSILAFPPPPDRSSLFAEELAKPGEIPVFEALSAWNVVSRALSRQPAPNRGYPRTRFLAKVMSLISKKPASPVKGAELFLDALAHAQAQGLEMALVTGNRPSYQEFRRQAGRLVPGLNLHLYLEADTANARRPDATALLSKLHPAILYLGADIKDRRPWAAQLASELSGLKAIILGHRDFEIYTRPSRVGKGPTGPLSDWLEEMGQSPWRLFTTPFSALFALDALRVKWLGHYKVEEP